MEFLSSTSNASSNPAYLVMQTPESALAGYNALGTPTYDAAKLPFPAPAVKPSYHEYRFDWTPTQVLYYADSVLLDVLDHDYKASNGSIFLNHWSNGNKLWSRGPPLNNAVLTISYVKAYFNSSDPGKGQAFEKACTAADKDKSQACVIPNQKTPPDPGLANDDSAAKTLFFNHGMCGESRAGGPGSQGSSSSASKGSSAATSLAMDTELLFSLGILWAIWSAYVFRHDYRTIIVRRPRLADDCVMTVSVLGP